VLIHPRKQLLFFTSHGVVKDRFLQTKSESGRVRGFTFVAISSINAYIACEKRDEAGLEKMLLRVNENHLRVMIVVD